MGPGGGGVLAQHFAEQSELFEQFAGGKRLQLCGLGLQEMATNLLLIGVVSVFAAVRPPSPNLPRHRAPRRHCAARPWSPRLPRRRRPPQVGLLLYTKLLVDYDSEAAATIFLVCMLLAMVVLPLEVYEQVSPT